MEIPAKLFHGPQCLGIGLLQPVCFIRQIFGRIALRHLYDILFRATLWTGYLYMGPFLSRQPFLHQLLFLQRAGQKHLPRHKNSLMIILLQKRCQHSFIRFLSRPGQKKMLAPHHLAAPDEKDLHAGPQCGAGQTHSILIARTGHDALLLRNFPHCPQLVTQPGSQFELQSFRRRTHALGQLLFHPLRPPLHEKTDLPDHGRIFCCIHLSHTRSQATMDMVLQTRTIHIQMLAGAQRKQAPQKTQVFMQGPRIGIGTKIPRPILQYPPGNKSPWKFLLHGDLQIGIALIILETDIIARPMLFNQIALQDECFHLGAGQYCLEISNFRHHGPHLCRMVLTTLEILPHPILQHDGLAHIDDLSLRILHDIDTGRIRQLLQLLSHDIRHIHHPPTFHSYYTIALIYECIQYSLK